MEDMRDKILASLSLFGLEHENELTFYYSGLNMQIEFSGVMMVSMTPCLLLLAAFLRGAFRKA